ncbi:MAG TPA: hypothetical protein VNS09_20190 [Solirubrobacter sp.]|nr:hypothetical protein [Solirubrobacter sp.]
MTQPPPREFTEEEIAAIEAEMERLKVDDVLLQTLVTLINLGARKAGLATPPGEEPPARDLEQTKQAIEGARALLPLLEERHGAQLAPVKDALSSLQMAYVQLSGAKPEEPQDPEGPGPAQSSGRLWVPGQ